MMKSGATLFRRLLACLLTAALLLTTLTVPALALEDWENLAVSVTWTDAEGNQWTVPAWRIPEDLSPHGYWVTLDAAALNTALEVSMIHPDPGYTFWRADQTMTLYWMQDKDALELDSMYADYIGYSYNGVPMVSGLADYIELYVSTQLPPFEAEPVEVLPGAILREPEFVAGEAVVPVYYKHENGQLLDVIDVTLGEGYHILRPESGKVAGYELITAAEAGVTVYPGGYSDVASVTFLYRDAYVAPAEATIDVYYVHEDGTLLDLQQKTLPEGTHTLYAESSLVSGYELVGDNAAFVTVYANGQTDVASVTFLYRDVYVAPAEATIPVYYYHENGQLLEEKWITLSEGTTWVQPDSNQTAGLELVSEASVAVTVDAYGNASAPNVVFLYRDVYVAPAEATIPVYYYHENGQLLEEKWITLSEGTTWVQPDSNQTAGLELVSEGSVAVTVDANGNASAPNVVFLYRDPYVAPVTGEATVIYMLEDYTVLEQKVITLQPGDNWVQPDSKQTEGLELVGEASVHAYVDGGGAVSPNPIIFTYRQAAPKQAEITVFYYDTMGNEIAPRQTDVYAPGYYEIRPDASNVPAGYELMSDPVLYLTVYSDGNYDLQEVSFWYRPAPVETEAPAEQNAAVTVRYLDSRGYPIADEELLSLGSGTHEIHAYVPEGYELFDGQSDTVTVTVSGGRANQNVITFYYREVVKTPTAYPVTIHYYDTEGREIGPAQTRQLTPGTYWIDADFLTADYELVSDSPFQLIVGEDGSLNLPAADVGFWYKPVEKAPVKGLVTVRYTDRSGALIAGPYTYELDLGKTHTISPDASLIPGIFDASTASPVRVYVSTQGVANPAEVTFALDLKVVETPIPVGMDIGRYGTVNGSRVAFRSEPSTRGGNGTIIRRLNKGEVVYMVRSDYNDSGETWTQVIVNGQVGYMQSSYLDTMTQKQSDEYAASVGATPVPTFTPVPTATPVPTEAFVEFITPVPVTPVPYQGYALASAATYLRTGTGSGDMNIRVIEAGELLVVRRTADAQWSSVETMNGQAGYVRTAVLQQITEREAAVILQNWQQQNATPSPTPLVTNVPEMEQWQGYGYTQVDNVPFRMMASDQSSIIGVLDYMTPIYIAGQIAVNGEIWHSVAVDGQWGYIRADLARLMTEAEENAYLDELFATPTPTPVTTNRPYDENGLSSFGYVTSSSVNFREGASKQAKFIRELKRYAFCTVLDVQRVSGTTWYKVDYNGVQGYVHGDYFHQMTIREFQEFYRSDLYYQGIDANSGSDDDDDGNGGIISAEDQTVNNWYQSGNEIEVSYAPFNPVATQPPIYEQGYPTLEPIPGLENTTPPTSIPGFSGSGSVSGGMDDVAPSPTNTVKVTYGNESDGKKGFDWRVAVLVIVLLLIVGGGVYVYVQQERKRRKMAMRAAQRRAQAARSAAERPVARRAGEGQSRTGAYPRQAAQDYQTSDYTYAFRSNEEAAQRQNVSYQAPAEQSVSGKKPGRRTAYQQALAEQQKRDGDSRNQ